MRKGSWLAVFAFSSAGAVAAWWLVRNSRLCEETAPYTMHRREGPFELREYPTLLLAGTAMDGENDSFMRLFGYISGQNHERRKIAMTTPVLVAEDYGSRTMNFVLPETLAAKGPPKPIALDVEAATMRGGLFAVYRYNGVSDVLTESGNAAVLRAWMDEQGLDQASEAVIALYDPPWTPGPLRRNEILLRIQGA